MDVASETGALLVERHLSLVTAESSSGGYLAHRITSVPGSSQYYLGGWVAYANEAKERFLGVRRRTLETHGAVSAETAGEMARGARRAMGADIGLSITGIAGPTGGTADKPLGLVYVALSAPDEELCRRFLFTGDRLAHQERAAEAALEVLLSYLQEQSH
jgi:nicotinamide-nucleotide amidase